MYSKWQSMERAVVIISILQMWKLSLENNLSRIPWLVPEPGLNPFWIPNH